MIHASITEARNRFSRLLRSVRRGETVLITDHGSPVARIEPCSGQSDDDWIADRVARGIVRPPKGRLDVEALLARPTPRLPDSVSASDAVTADREESW